MKPKVYLLSYSTPNFRLSQILLKITAKFFGCDFIITETYQKFIKSAFYLKHHSILEQKRGSGYWLWKYYFINDLIHKINDGDVIIYADSGLFFRKSITELITILTKKTKGVLLFYNDYSNRFWTKRDCFINLNCDTEEFHNSPQIGAQLQFFQKNDFSLKFVTDVLFYSCKGNLITDSENILGKKNLDGFIEHRHDQSITSLIAHKYNITLYPDPSQFKTKDVIYTFPNEEKLPESIYKNIVYVHRLRGFSIFILPFKLINEFYCKLKNNAK